MRTAVPLILVACAKNPSPSSAPARMATEHSCRVGVRRLVEAAPAALGEAQGADEEIVKSQAWAMACGALPTDLSAACGTEAPPEGWTWVAGGGPVTSGGQTTWSLRIELTDQRTGPEQSGSASSTSSLDEACDLAFAQACEALGAHRGCEGAPGFEVAMRSTSTRTVTPPMD
jgi:hypothetical protein